MTLTPPNVERLAVELSLSVLKIKVCRGWDSNTQPLTPPIADRLAVELSQLILTTNVFRGWDSSTQPCAGGANASIYCAAAAACNWLTHKLV